MAKNTMKDVERNVDEAIDHGDDGFNASFKGQFGQGPSDDKMFGPGDGKTNLNRDEYIRSQQAVQSRGTDSDIEDYSRARAAMGQPIRGGGELGGPDRGMANEINQAWMNFYKNPTDANGQYVKDMLNKHGIESDFGEDQGQ